MLIHECMLKINPSFQRFFWARGKAKSEIKRKGQERFQPSSLILMWRSTAPWDDTTVISRWFRTHSLQLQYNISWIFLFSYDCIPTSLLAAFFMLAGDLLYHCRQSILRYMWMFIRFATYFCCIRHVVWLTGENPMYQGCNWILIGAVRRFGNQISVKLNLNKKAINFTVVCYNE